MKFNSRFNKRYSAVLSLLVVLSLSVYLTGCETGNQIESLVQPNPDEFTVLFSDTSTVSLSTVGADSIITGSPRTSAPGRMLVGRYVDPYFGKIQASSFFQITTSGAITVPEQAVYDSLVLSLTYSKYTLGVGDTTKAYTYGDTTIAMNLSVHKLQSDIQVKEAYFNSTTMSYDAVPVGQIKIAPRPKTNRELRIKLSDVLGKDIFSKAQNNLITSNNDWINLVKGFVLKPSITDNGAIVGFVRASTNLQIHYHTSNADGIEKASTNLNLAANYNQILGDRLGTQLAKLPVTQRIALPSAQAGNMSFIQGGLGVMTRVDFPFVKQLKYEKYSVVNRAYLRITPLRASLSDFTTPPATLYVYLCDRNNEPLINSSTGYPIPLLKLTGSNAVASSYIIDLIGNKQYYLLDVSSYITTVVNSEFIETGGLLIRTSPYGEIVTNYPELGAQFGQTVNRLVIGDQNNADPGVKLEMYYTRVKAE